MEIQKDQVMNYRYRFIVAGTRGYTDYEELCHYVNRYICHTCGCSLSHCFHSGDDVLIISGDASSGADALAIQFAKDYGYDWVRFPADWNKFFKAAGNIRNAEMGDVATDLIAFWDLESRGTKNMIIYATGKLDNVYLVPITLDPPSKTKNKKNDDPSF